MRHSIKRKQGKEGIATIWTVIFFLALVMFLGLVVDTGYLALARQQMQTVADASALSGAYSLKSDVAASRIYARNIGGMNYAAGVYVDLELNVTNDPAGDIVVGRFNRGTKVFTPTLTYPNAIQTNPRRTAAHPVNTPVDLIFGDLMGKTQQDTTATAIAMVHGGLGAGVIALNLTESCTLDLRGTPSEFSVNGGVVYVNSNNAEAMCHSGKPLLDTAEVYVVGGTDRNYEQVDVTGDIIYTDDPILDPLADLPDPPYNVANDLGGISPSGSGDVVNAGPGYYSEGITQTTGTVNLSPGIYILDGEGLNITGGDFFAPGCMFFIIDSTPGDPKDSDVDIRGNGIVQTSAPETDTPSSDVNIYAEAGVTIFQARDNTNDSRILGTADTNLTGTIYMPSNHIEIGGTSANIATGLIADTIELHGNGLMGINYDGRYGIIPPNVYLVF